MTKYFGWLPSILALVCVISAPAFGASFHPGEVVKIADSDSSPGEGTDVMRAKNAYALEVHDYNTNNFSAASAVDAKDQISVPYDTRASVIRYDSSGAQGGHKNDLLYVKLLDGQYRGLKVWVTVLDIDTRK